jgi:hypothetical protein
MNVSKYEYRVVPFIAVVKSGDKSETAAKQLETILMQYAASGWELYQVTAVDVEVKPGCLAAFFGSGSSYTKLDQVVFRREREVPSA